MKTRYCLLLTYLITATALAQAPDANNKLTNYKLQYQQATDDANLSRTALDTHQIELNSAQVKLQSLKTERDKERTQLDELRAAAEKMPTIDFADQISHQNDTVYQAGKNYQLQLEQVKTIQESISEHKTRYAIALEQEKNFKKSITSLLEQQAGAEMQARLQNLNQSKQISVEIRETCSLQITQGACRDQAKAKTERQAAEKGALVMVESVTEIKNFNMSKDEIRSRVKVQLSDLQVTRDHYDLTADKTGWTIDYAITATVTPVITDAMRQDMKAQVIAEISGGWIPAQFPETLTATPPQTAPVSSKAIPAKNKPQDAKTFWQP